MLPLMQPDSIGIPSPLPIASSNQIIELGAENGCPVIAEAETIAHLLQLINLIRSVSSDLMEK